MASCEAAPHSDPRLALHTISSCIVHVNKSLNVKLPPKNKNKPAKPFTGYLLQVGSRATSAAERPK